MKRDSPRGDTVVDFRFWDKDFNDKLTVVPRDSGFTFYVRESGRYSMVDLSQRDVETLVSVLSELLAPEPTLPVGQRRRSPGGVEVVKTDDWKTPWRGTRGLAWFTDAEVADWDVVA